jgi:hypothetical protein
VHANPWIYKIFVDRRRPIPAGAVLHSSVRARMDANRGPTPHTSGAADGADAGWADADWTTLRPVPPAPIPLTPTPPPP